MNAGCAGKTVRSLENVCIPECLRVVFMTRCYTNPCLPLPYNGNNLTNVPAVLEQKTSTYAPSPYDLYCVGGTLSLTQSINHSTYAITHSLVYSVEMHWDRQTYISKKSTDGCSRGIIIQHSHMYEFHMQIKILKISIYKSSKPKPVMIPDEGNWWS